MKALFVFFFAIITVATTEKSQETETIKATFTEYIDEIYYFTDSEGYTIEFNDVLNEVLVKYDLADEQFKGKLFIVTYETDTEMDEEGDDMATNTIIDLKLVE
ncbi:MAG: hypothetical protein WBM53_06930 [Maribacter sp.]